jgi:hypothetical protein
LAVFAAAYGASASELVQRMIREVARMDARFPGARITVVSRDWLALNADALR